MKNKLQATSYEINTNGLKVPVYDLGVRHRKLSDNVAYSVYVASENSTTVYKGEDARGIHEHLIKKGAAY